MSARAGAGTADPPAVRPVAHAVASRSGTGVLAHALEPCMPAHVGRGIYGAVNAVVVPPDVLRGRAGAP